MKAHAVQRNNPASQSPPGTAESSEVKAAPAQLASPALRDIVRAGIAASGPVPFREFMRLALYHPLHGYYRSGRANIGRHGDYFTNVSVGALFGTLLARQFAEMWMRLGHPSEFLIVEQGAHGGQLAADILDATRRLLPEFVHAARYIIIEPSPRLRTLQRRRLAEFAAKLTWRRSLDELGSFCGVHFSNELLDAFPVDSLVWDGKSWLERRIDFAANRFVFADLPLTDPTLLHRLEQYPAPAGIRYAIEINAAAEEWINAVAAHLSSGYLLTIDYGGAQRDLVFPARTSGTVRGYSEHRRIADILADPGTIDLTANVDFTALARAAERSNAWRLHGFADQHHFMVGLGVLHFHDSDDPSETAARELRNFKTLMHPEIMGTSFHAVCFEKAASDHDRATPLAGFHFAPDPRAALELE